MNTKPVSARGLLRFTMRLVLFLALLGLLTQAPRSRRMPADRMWST